MIFDLEMLKRLKDENAIEQWLEEQWLTDFIEAELIKNKHLKPVWDYSKNKYVSNYVLHCPVFNELLHSDSESATLTLWEIKEHSRKLSFGGLKDLNCTFRTCGACKGLNGRKACGR